MTITQQLARAAGRGVKIFAGTFAVTGNGAVTTTGTVQAAVATVSNAATALPSDTAAITSYSGATVNIVVIQHATNSNSVESGAKNVDVFVISQ